MKLLAKKSIDVEVAAQKKAQIDEGVSIAKKVDVLRNTLSSLETQHRRFLDGISSELKRETQSLIETIASLRIEISDLEEKRKKLLEPLDEEWENVKLKSKEILAREQKISETESHLDFREIRIDERDKKSKESVSRANLRERELERTLEHTQILYEGAEKEKKESDLYKITIEKDLEVKSEAIGRSQRRLDEEIRGVDHQKELNLLKEKELLEKERAINDKYQTLLRSEARLKK